MSSSTMSEEWQQVEFVPHDYLRTSYSINVSDNLLTPSFLTFTLDNMNNTFKGGELTGTMIDVGCGPTIHCLISASAYCDSIVCSDYTPANRAEVKKWLNQDPTIDFDWLPFFKYAAEIEKKRTLLEMQDDVRKKVKDVIHCDVRTPEVIQRSSDKEQFDIVLSSLCVEEATNNKDNYFKCLQNVISLLKPEGTLVLFVVINQSQYNVGEICHYTAAVSCEEVKNFLKTDFEIVDSAFIKSEDQTLGDYDGFLFVRAKLHK